MFNAGCVANDADGDGADADHDCNDADALFFPPSVGREAIDRCEDGMSNNCIPGEVSSCAGVLDGDGYVEPPACEGNPLIRPGAEGGLAITPTQFQIRVTEHLEAAKELVAQIVRGAGYSVQTFGAAGDVAVTATEVAAKERRSELTRDKKITYVRPGIAQAVEALLAVDAVHFRSGVTPERPTVEFGDRVSETPASLAQTAQLLRAAEAASTETLVAMVHPDWDEPQVTEEVERIKGESAPVELTPPGPEAGMDATGPGGPDEQGDGGLDAAFDALEGA
jgi:hypothetical protein